MSTPLPCVRDASLFRKLRRVQPGRWHGWLSCVIKFTCFSETVFSEVEIPFFVEALKKKHHGSAHEARASDFHLDSSEITSSFNPILTTLPATSRFHKSFSSYRDVSRSSNIYSLSSKQHSPTTNLMGRRSASEDNHGGRSQKDQSN